MLGAIHHDASALTDLPFQTCFRRFLLFRFLCGVPVFRGAGMVLALINHGGRNDNRNGHLPISRKVPLILFFNGTPLDEDPMNGVVIQDGFRYQFSDRLRKNNSPSFPKLWCLTSTFSFKKEMDPSNNRGDFRRFAGPAVTNQESQFSLIAFFVHKEQDNSQSETASFKPKAKLRSKDRREWKEIAQNCQCLCESIKKFWAIGFVYRLELSCFFLLRKKNK